MGTLILSLEEVTQQFEERFPRFSNLNYQIRLIINEILRQLGVIGRINTMGSMNLEEFLKGWSCETTQSPRIEAGNCSSLQNHGSLGISENFSEKIDDEVWREIQQGENIKVGGGVKREPSMGEMTLEDFLTKEGAIDECPLMPMDVGAQCDTPTPVSEHKRNPSEKFERGNEKKLNRKIKNRESAARSRARKQAYHNELVSKVSCLEEQNMRLKKEQEMESRFFDEMSPEPRFQLRRTSSAIF